MSTDYLEIGLKVLAAIAGGIAVFAGLTCLGESGPKDCPTTNELTSNPNQFNDTGKKVVEGIRVGQTILSGTLNVLGSVAMLTTSISQVLDKKHYRDMTNDPLVQGGYFGSPVVPTSLYDINGLPYGRPMYQENGTTWVRSNTNIIDVY